MPPCRNVSRSDAIDLAQQIASTCNYGLPNQKGVNTSPVVAYNGEGSCYSDFGYASYGAVFIKRGAGKSKCFCQGSSTKILGRAAAPAVPCPGVYAAFAYTVV